MLVDFQTMMKGSYSDKVKSLMLSSKKRMKSGILGELVENLYPDEDPDKLHEEFRVKGNEREKYDYTGASCNKRIDATIKYIGEAKRRFGGIRTPSEIESFFAFSNSLLFRGGYNYDVDRYNSTALAAAIWILDEIMVAGKMQELRALLPDTNGIEWNGFMQIHPVNHPMYDRDLIISVVTMIRLRNSDYYSRNPFEGTLRWDSKRPDRDEASLRNRKAFDDALSLIDQKSIKDACQNYENKVWEFYELTLRASAYVDDRIRNLEEERNQVGFGIEKKIPFLDKQPTALLHVESHEYEKGESETDRLTTLTEEMIRLESITFSDFSLPNDRERVVQDLNDILPADLAERIISFHVEDPFETAFALLYLLDSRSLVPWMYYGSISVAYTMYDQLPYDVSIEIPTNPERLTGMNEFLYRHRFDGYRWDDAEDNTGGPVKRSLATNLSQLIVSGTGSLIPRVNVGQQGMDECLHKLGDISENEKRAYMLLFQVMNAGKIRAIESFRDRLLGEEEPEPDAELTEDIDTDDVNVIKRENERLRAKNDELIARYNELINDKRSMAEQLEAFRVQDKLQNQELADLREIIYLLDNEEAVEEKTEKNSRYPFRTKQKILSFGGHPSWIREMKLKLPDVIFTAPDTLPNPDLIRNADVIWIQPNYISHSDYYRIINNARASGVRIRYFMSSGADKCSEQLVKSIHMDK